MAPKVCQPEEPDPRRIRGRRQTTRLSSSRLEDPEIAPQPLSRAENTRSAAEREGKAVLKRVRDLSRLGVWKVAGEDAFLADARYQVKTFFVTLRIR